MLIFVGGEGGNILQQSQVYLIIYQMTTMVVVGTAHPPVGGQYFQLVASQLALLIRLPQKFGATVPLM
jgi:hypothetical protein